VAPTSCCPKAALWAMAQWWVRSLTTQTTITMPKRWVNSMQHVTYWLPDNSVKLEINLPVRRQIIELCHTPVIKIWCR